MKPGDIADNEGNIFIAKGNVRKSGWIDIDQDQVKRALMYGWNIIGPNVLTGQITVHRAAGWKK